ncbi:MAG: GFA family protein [Candidatus Binatia bacterium]
MPRTGRCHCGAIHYRVDAEPKHVVLCHCGDCRRSSGAPMVAWAAFAEEDLVVTQGSPKTINSSGAAMRSFCADCGSGLFYRNAEVLPGIVDIQSATLDDPGALPPHIHIQTAERLGWMKDLDSIPAFERFPG